MGDEDFSWYLFQAGEYKMWEWISLFVKVTAEMSILDYLKPWDNANFVDLSKYLWEVGYRLNPSHYTDKKWNHWALEWFMKQQVNVRRGKKEIWSLVSSLRILSEGFLLLRDHICTFDSLLYEHWRNYILQKVECENDKGDFSY